MRSLIVCMVALAAVSNALSLGNMLHRDYTVYKSMPTTANEAAAMGWGPVSGTCESGLGIAYSQKNGAAPDEHNPLWMYFTPAGQASGAATLFLNHVEKEKKNLIDNGYIVALPGGKSGQYYVSVGFRSAADSCATTNSTEVLGDRLVVHPNGIAHSLPLTPTDAWNRGWVKGSCFAGMGTHWFRDITSFGSLTWKAANLLPIVTMYDEESPNPTNQINAFFFASSVVQQELLPPHTNDWEPVPLPNILMCKNMCNSSCTFTDTDFYSTMHIYMNNYKDVSCKNGCSLGCCGN